MDDETSDRQHSRDGVPRGEAGWASGWWQRPGSARRISTEPGRAKRAARTEPGTDQDLSLAVASRDYIWLYDSRGGLSYQKIAVRDRVSVRQVRDGIKPAALEAKVTKDDPVSTSSRAARAMSGFWLIPLFPIGSFTPESACPHREPMGRGTTLCCMVCHASGMDDHPGLRRDPETDPSTESEPAPAPAVAESETSDSPRETRKQRRRRQFAEAATVA